MDRLRELELLKMRARRMEGRLRALHRRLDRMGQPSVGPLLRPVVKMDRCKGCGACETVCPTGAVRVENVAWIDTRRCVGCGRCAEACPAKAIVLEWILPDSVSPGAGRGMREGSRFNGGCVA